MYQRVEEIEGFKFQYFRLIIWLRFARIKFRTSVMLMWNKGFLVKQLNFIPGVHSLAT